MHDCTPIDSKSGQAHTLSHTHSHSHANEQGSNATPHQPPKYTGNAPTPLVTPSQIALEGGFVEDATTPPPFSLSRLSRTLVSSRGSLSWNLKGSYFLFSFTRCTQRQAHTGTHIITSHAHNKTLLNPLSQTPTHLAGPEPSSRWRWHLSWQQLQHFSHRTQVPLPHTSPSTPALPNHLSTHPHAPSAHHSRRYLANLEFQRDLG